MHVRGGSARPLATQPSSRQAQPYPPEPDVSADRKGGRRDSGGYGNRQPAKQRRAPDLRSRRRMATRASPRARDGGGRRDASDRVASAFRSLRRNRAPAGFRRAGSCVSARANLRTEKRTRKRRPSAPRTTPRGVS